MSISARFVMRVLASVLALTVAAGGAVVLAAALDSPATVSEVADRVERPPTDTAVVFDVGDVDRFVVEAAGRVASRVGGAATTGRTGSLGMQRITRGGATVHAPPSGYLIPMVYSALPRGSIGRIMGSDVPAVLAPDAVVMNEVTAELTGARVGDVIVMQSASGAAVPLRIAGIRPYEQIGWGELVFDYDVAERLGATADTRAVIYGFGNRSAFDAALVAEGLAERQDTKVIRSWDPPNPDSTLSTARTKVALGEPWYTFASDGSVIMHPTWKANHLTPDRELLNDTIRIRARCHVRVVDDLRAALAEVAAAGLAGAIEVGNANTSGGCYVPRFSRVSGQIGFLSRHTYGMALDTNTVSNCAGCVPRMNCDVVRIFRKHGFAWGGNFRRPDGMHFEWVGERLDQLPYPSRYCPNIVAGGARPDDGTESADRGVGVGVSDTTTIGVGVLIAGHDDHEHHHHGHHDH